MIKKKAHQIFQDFSYTVTDDLDEEGYFELEDGDKKNRSTLYKVLGLGFGGLLAQKLYEQAMEKNREVLPIIQDEVMQPALRTVVSDYMGTPLDADRLELLTRQYYEEHSLKFVKSLSETDVRRLRGYVWMGRDKAPSEFTGWLQQRYVFDASGGRLETIDRTETHRAENGGNYILNGDNANWKRRIGRYVAPWPRDTHQEDIDLGWIPYDEAYPNTGEMFSGESEINCYCKDEYGFDEEMPSDE